MMSQAALIFFAIIPAILLCTHGSQGNYEAEVTLEPGVPFCGHISPSSADYYGFIIDPGASEISFLIRWRQADSPPLKMMLHSPNGNDFIPSMTTNVTQGRAQASLILPELEAGLWVAEVASGHTSSNGNDYCLVMEPVSKKDETAQPFARFNGLYRDYSIDEDGNGINEYAIVKIGVNIKKPGNYSIEGLLYNANNGREIPISSGSHFKIGSKAFKLQLFEMGTSGPYCLKNLTLYDERGVVLDRAQVEYTTRENMDLETRWAKLSGNYSDYGSDIDGDGLYDYLSLDVGVEVFSPGNYSLVGFLCDPNGSSLLWSLGFEHLLPGIHIMHVDFDGKTLRRSKIDGPYNLCNLSLFRGDSTVENLTAEDTFIGKYETKAYSCTQFENAA